MTRYIRKGTNDIINHSNKAFKMSVNVVLQTFRCIWTIVFWIIISNRVKKSQFDNLRIYVLSFSRIAMCKLKIFFCNTLDWR